MPTVKIFCIVAILLELSCAECIQYETYDAPLCRPFFSECVAVISIISKHSFRQNPYCIFTCLWIEFYDFVTICMVIEVSEIYSILNPTFLSGEKGFKVRTFWQGLWKMKFPSRTTFSCWCWLGYFRVSCSEPILRKLNAQSRYSNYRTIILISFIISIAVIFKKRCSIFRSESPIFEIPSGDTSKIYSRIYSQFFFLKKVAIWLISCKSTSFLWSEC